MGGPLNTKLVLAVGLEDNDPIGLRSALADRGFDSELLSCPWEALDVIDSKTPGTIVISTKLPGLDAERFANMVRQHQPNVGIIFAHGHRLEAEYFDKRFTQPTAFLMRPVNPEALGHRAHALHTGDLAFERAESQSLKAAEHVASLEEPSFGPLLVQLNELRATGALTVQNKLLRKKIYFHRGVPCYAESNVLHENLGKFLVRRNVISADDLEKARKVQLESGIKQGEALVQIGLLTHAQLFEHLQEQICEKIVNCFSLESAEYSFQPDREFLVKKLRFELNLLHILVEGHSRFPSTNPLNDSEYNGKTYYVVGDPQAPMWAFADDALPESMGQWLNQGMTSADLRQQASWDDNHVKAVLGALTLSKIAKTREGRPHTSGMIALPSSGDSGTHEAAASADLKLRTDKIVAQYLRYQSASYYEALEVSPKASDDVIRAARDGLLDDYRSWVFIRDLPESAQQKVREIVDKIRMAGDVLLDAERREAYDAALTRPAEAQTDTLIEAEVQHVLGMDLLAERDYDGARKCFAQAVEFNPDEPTYQLYCGWASYRAAAPGSEERLAARKAVAEATDMNPLIDMGYYFLGCIMLDEGNRVSAREQYEYALHFNPENVDAQAALAAMD